MGSDLLKKARTAQSPDDLVTLAEKGGLRLSKSDAEHYFNAVKSKGEISDDELDNVSGGACYTDDGYMKTTCGYSCSYYEDDPEISGVFGTCYKCKYWKIACASTLYLLGMPATCTNPMNRKKK